MNEKCEVCSINIPIGEPCKFSGIRCYCGTKILGPYKGIYKGISDDGKLHLFNLIKSVSCPECGNFNKEGSVPCKGSNGLGEELAQELFATVLVEREGEK